MTIADIYDALAPRLALQEGRPRRSGPRDPGPRGTDGKLDKDLLGIFMEASLRAPPPRWTGSGRRPASRCRPSSSPTGATPPTVQKHVLLLRERARGRGRPRRVRRAAHRGRVRIVLHDPTLERTTTGSRPTSADRTDGGGPRGLGRLPTAVRERPPRRAGAHPDRGPRVPARPGPGDDRDQGGVGHRRSRGQRGGARGGRGPQGGHGGRGGVPVLRPPRDPPPRGPSPRR